MSEAARIVTVYGLASSEDDRIRYIGQTLQTPQKRLASHRCIPKRYAHTPLYRWIAKAKQGGFQIELVILHADAIWSDTEREMVAAYRAAGHSLLNCTDGGDGRPGYVMPDTSRQKIATARSGMKFSEAHCRAMSAVRLGRSPKPEAIEKQRAAMKGRLPKNLAAIHAAKVGKPRPQETREKIAAALQGKPVNWSIEGRARITAAAIKAHTGVPKSEETRRRISETKRRKNAEKRQAMEIAA